MYWRTLLATLALFAGAALGTDWPAVPPARHEPAKAEPVAQMLLASPAQVHAIRLAEPTVAERSRLADAAKAALVSTRANKPQPLPIGYSRVPPGVNQAIPLASLHWENVAGGQAARVSLQSPTAAAVRLALQWKRAPADSAAVQFRFTGSSAHQVFGPVGGDRLTGEDLYWSPVLEGDQAVLELFVANGGDVQNAVLTVPQISHLEVSGADLKAYTQKRVQDIGSSDACEVDVACVQNPSQALLNAARSVAQMIFTDSGNTYACSGNLLNTTTAEGIPYFYSANHCISTQQMASTLNTYWFFAAPTCGSADPNYTIIFGGATLLFNDANLDVSFMRLNSNPPAGAFFGGWNANAVSAGSPAVVLHYPHADLEKFSQGTTQGYSTFNGRGSFISMLYNSGSTEVGSSGAGLWTFNAGGYYELRGGLYGGDAACDNMGGRDSYSRLDQAYPYISVFLAPIKISGNLTVWEFYNTILGHYFITADANEATGIDQGAAGPGWVRTQLSFKAYPLGQAASVCRFYGTPGTGPNSHFYTVDVDECNQVKLDPGWTYEGIVFGMAAPVGGACPAGTVAVYRAYNNGFVRNDSNHRFTVDFTVYQQMVNAGWTGEGIVMCAPPS